MELITSLKKQKPIDSTFEDWKVGHHYRYEEPFPDAHFIVRIIEKSQNDWGVTLNVEIVYDFTDTSLEADITATAGKKFIAAYKHGVYGSYWLWTMDEVDLEKVTKVIAYRLK